MIKILNIKDLLHAHSRAKVWIDQYFSTSRYNEILGKH